MDRKKVMSGLAVLMLALIPFGIFGCGQKRIVDNIDLPFVNDPDVIGVWNSVDHVAEPALFTAGIQLFKGDLYMKGLTFLDGGKILWDNKTEAPWFTWTKGVVMHSGDKTASAYTIKDIGGVKYMFFEWKSGDYTIRHMKPKYYVLKRK